MCAMLGQPASTHHLSVHLEYSDRNHVKLMKTPINLKPLISLKKLTKPTISDNYNQDIKNYFTYKQTATNKFTRRRSSENVPQLIFRENSQQNETPKVPEMSVISDFRSQSKQQFHTQSKSSHREDI